MYDARFFNIDHLGNSVIYVLIWISFRNLFKEENLAAKELLRGKKVMLQQMSEKLASLKA